MCKTWSQLLTDLETAMENVDAGTSVQTASANASTKQVTELVYDNDTIKTGYRYTVMVDFREYTATVGQSGVTDTWSSILGNLASLSMPTASHRTAVSDAAHYKLVLTAKNVNTRFFTGDPAIGRVHVVWIQATRR
jgi:hypothetical protein